MQGRGLPFGFRGSLLATVYTDRRAEATPQHGGLQAHGRLLTSRPTTANTSGVVAEPSGADKALLERKTPCPKADMHNKCIVWVFGWRHPTHCLFPLIENLGGKGSWLRANFPETVPGPTGYLYPRSHGSALDLLHGGLGGMHSSPDRKRRGPGLPSASQAPCVNAGQL